MRKQVLVGLALLLGSAAVSAEDVESRVARLERLLESQSLVEMLTRLDRLQQEVQQLRGEVEMQSHALEELKQRQRDLYLDVDRRLSRVEREAVGGGAVAPKPAGDAGIETPAAPDKPATGGAAAATPSLVSPSGDDERNAYQAAFDLLRELRYEQAIAAFGEFLDKYPNGRYAHIAQYWLGEANYARRDFRQAITAYRELLQNYPRSPKLAEAMLKIGYSHAELGEGEQARQSLEALVQRYPDTTEAGQARNFLQKMKMQER